MKGRLPKPLKGAVAWRDQHPELKGRQTLRWCAGASDACPGWIIDRYGDGLIATDYQGSGDGPSLLRELQELFPHLKVHLKQRNKGFQWFGSEEPWTCEELDSKFEIRTDLRHDFGLFIDTHAPRRWLAEHAKGARVLNLFAYTCAFGVIAAHSGASQVTNIDANRSYLDWGRCNAQANGVDFRNYEDTVQKYMARHLKRLQSGKDEPYDIIVADPPAFLVGRGDDRLGRKLWPLLFEQLHESGATRLVLINNDRAFLTHRSWLQVAMDHLPSDWKVSHLPQSPDCLGQRSERSDPHYQAPPVLIALRE